MTRPGGSLDLRDALFHIPGGKIHRLGNHPNSLVNNALMLIANANIVKGGPFSIGSGCAGCRQSWWTGLKQARLWTIHSV